MALSNILDLDLLHAPPAQRGSGLTLVPPGPYLLEITEAKAEMSKGDPDAGKAPAPMVHVSFQIADGEHYGSPIEDYFDHVPPGPDDKLFGLQRFHAFLLACGFQPKNPKVKLDLGRLAGRKCTANLYSVPLTPTAQYPNPRDASKIRSYEISPTPATSPASSNGASPATPAAASQEATAVVAQATPTATGVVVAAPAQTAPTAPAEGTTADSGEEDLFA